MIDYTEIKLTFGPQRSESCFLGCWLIFIVYLYVFYLTIFFKEPVTMKRGREAFCQMLQ